MIEQITFDTVEIKTAKELLEQIVIETSEKWNCSTKLFRIEENKNKEKLIGYSLYFEKSLILKTDTDFVALSFDIKVYNGLSVKAIRTKELKSPQNFIQCTFCNQDDTFEAGMLISDESIKKYEPADFFGCCGLYEKCSDAKKCLHSDLIRSKSCYYKKNLESGRIFYGENANN